MTKMPALIICLILTLTGAVSAQEYKAEEVSFTSGSGYKIVATYYHISGETGPALLLIPNMERSRSTWKDFLPALWNGGIKSILAIDLPGNGLSNSKNGQKIHWRNFSEDDFTAISEELTAALDYLKSAQSTDTAHIGIMGAIMGSSYATVLAANNSFVRGIILLSPGMVYRGVSAYWSLDKFGHRPALLVATEGDFYSLSSCKKFKDVIGERAKMQIYDKPAAGTDILSINPSFKELLSSWLKSNL